MCRCAYTRDGIIQDKDGIMERLPISAIDTAPAKFFAFGKAQARACAKKLFALSAEERERAVVVCNAAAKKELSFFDFGGYAPETVRAEQAAALALLWKYPPALFLGKNSFNADDGTLKDGVRPVVAFFGFDETVAEIFKALVSTFVACISQDGSIREKQIPIRFFVRGRQRGQVTGMPYFSAAERLAACKEHSRLYYELPGLPCDVTATTTSDEKAVALLAAEGTCVWAVVARGNRERAGKIKCLLERAGVKHVVFYASEVGEENYRGAVGFDTGEQCADFFLRAERMAYVRNLVYDAEASKGGDSYLKALDDARKKWKKSAFDRASEIKRDSNLYASVAIRQILLTVGFDCAETGEDAKAEFDEIYDEGNPRVRDDKGVIVYDNATCARKSLRTALAEREHLRWNAYMFASGVSPATKEEYRTVNKNVLLGAGRHINLTTWRGLEDFRKEEARAKGTDEESTDVQRYDFQLADEAAFILENSGFRIVRGEEVPIC